MYGCGNTHASLHTSSSTPRRAYTNTRCRETCTVHTYSCSCRNFAYYFFCFINMWNFCMFLSCKPLSKDIKVQKPSLCSFRKIHQRFWTFSQLESTTIKKLAVTSNVVHLHGLPYFIGGIELWVPAIPVSLLLLPVVFPALRVDLFQQLSFQRETFYWLATLFENAWEADNWQ